MRRTSFTSKMLFFILVALLTLLVLGSAAAAYFGYQSFIEKDSTLSELKVKSRTLELQERSLVQAKREIQEYQELADIASAIVPQEKDQTRTVRELVAIASSLDIPISSVSFPASELGDKKATAGTITQVEKVPDIPGVFKHSVSVTLGSALTFDQLILFLDALEKNRRTSEISSINISPIPSRDGLSRDLIDFGLTFNIYIKQ